MADIEKLTWRQGTADDAPLLFALLAAEKAAEFAPLGFTPEQLQPLLDMQFRARQMSYGQNYPAAVDMVLVLPDGTPVGRHLVERQPDAYRSIDLAVLPEYRNSGIGTWALRQVQQLAALEGVSLRLRVIKTSPALRLYERLGFFKVSGDDLSYEMEWHPPTLQAAQQAKLPQTIQLQPGTPGVTISRRETLDRILPFLKEIGLIVDLGPVPQAAFLPGIQLIGGGLRIDLDALLYPGDLLHEAGHLAVMAPEQRHVEFPHSTDPGEEMAAIAWSYAAAMHLGLPPEIVFHEHGYRGASATLIQGYTTGNCPGLPILWWIGLTTQPTTSTPSIYPRMLRWVRETAAPSKPELQPQQELTNQ